MKKIATLLTVVAATASMYAVNCKRSISLVAPGEIKVELQIEKEGISGIARLAEFIPEGVNVKYAKAEGGKFDIQNNKVKVIWMALPEAKEMTVSYILSTDQLKEGEYNVNGKFSFLENGQTKDLEIAASIFSLNGKKEVKLGASPVANASLAAAPAITAEIKKAPVNTVANTTSPVLTVNTTSVGKPVYTIQVASTKDKLPADYFSKHFQINDQPKIDNVAGMNKYMFGEFNSLEMAQAYRESLAKKGITGAFVVATYNNQRISIEEAKKLENK